LNLLNNFCLVARGPGGEEGGGEKGWGWWKGGEMTQTLYAHVNKINLKKGKKKKSV
jgi:hypothetical protein